MFLTILIFIVIAKQLVDYSLSSQLCVVAILVMLLLGLYREETYCYELKT